MTKEGAEKFLDHLDPSQRKAALHETGPAVVFAGAGSGKTRIITTRIAYLIEKHLAMPWEILAVTFTNKAAGEMRERVIKLNPHASRALITTFHSACARWLREFATELGFTADFSIFDEQDSLSVIKSIMKQSEISLDKSTSASELRYAIGTLKTMGYLPHDVNKASFVFQSTLPKGGLEVFRIYQERMAMQNAMDFNDLLINMALLLRTNEFVRKTLQKRFKFVLVDEFQDTNDIQAELVRIITDEHKNLFVVGDDDQSIYSWRGAVPSYILDFSENYPNAKSYLLNKNYRSTKTILSAALEMVGHNKKRQSKEVSTDNEEGEAIDYVLEADAELEAWSVVENIKKEASIFPTQEVAVFYRTNSQSRSIEDALRHDNIPYQIFGTVRFYDRMEVKDLLAYLKLIVNPKDDLSLKRIINTPSRGIGDSSVEQMERKARELGLSLLETVDLFIQNQVPRLAGKLSEFKSRFAQLKSKVLQSSLAEVIEIILQETNYKEYLEKKFPEQVLDKLDNIHELATAVAEHASRFPDATISSWIQSISLASEQSGTENGVTLMTLHMAKGLEYERVYIVGLEDGILPHHNSLEDKDLIEEERRLFYVGMTRARKKLSLYGAMRRRTYDQINAHDPSRFLREIPKQSLKIGSDAAYSMHREQPHREDRDGLLYDYGDHEAINVGTVVSHPTYGKGVVENIEDDYGQVKAVVNFRDFGRRKVKTSHLEL